MIFGREVFVGKIDVSFDAGEDEEEAVGEFAEVSPEASAELLVGGGESSFAARVD